MRDEYDFSKMVGRKNPYAEKLKKQVAIRLSEDVIAYFRSFGEETGIPCQSLINLYLRDCVLHNRRPSMDWKLLGRIGCLTSDSSGRARPAASSGGSKSAE